MKKIICYAIIAFIALSACDDFLDIKPKGVVVPSTLSDFEYLLSEPYVFSRTSNMSAYMTDEITLPDDNRGDVRLVGISAIRAYDFEPLFFELDETDSDWENAYKTIYTCNTILTGIDKAESSPGIDRNRIRGEALVHRAFTYLQLVNAYAKHYDPATADTDMGVPMPLKPDINALLPRSSVKEVYALIENDLLEAAELLPDKAKHNYKPTKGAAYGILARVYLYKADYPKARTYAQKALDANNYLYDYNRDTAWVDPQAKYRGLKNFPNVTDDIKDIILYKYQSKVGAYAFTFFMSPELEAMYAPGDLRFTLGTTQQDWYGAALKGIGILSSNIFVGNYKYGGVQTNEMYLIRAEANAREGKIAEALNDLNSIRVKRFTPETYADLNASNKEEALQLVLRERRLELAFSGLRLADIKRLNREGHNIIVTHGKVTLTPDDNRLVMPIANKVLARNPNIKQNPR
ncbi:RagB/SusD family nutrient uptake outer membrane protein [Tannerella sp.]|uniref:RagB/SusD family nutrient uptake outer membrane protein n=1 Tax=Tannerella sp. TaxID=2382127 RepID=UPI0026DCEA34|nr:RagB/SusD family nutrient uptake outer membrane protein [Tannerella sp.]MDO4702980.1 RagB/SusD family nutrient uptake outer membrane protein [Tannerella sp.]